MNPFPQEKITKIRRQIDQALNAGVDPIAAFDADGTLWDTDIGEHFFQFQIAKNLLPDLPPNAWEHYRQWYVSETPGALVWLAQIMTGVPLATVRDWARQAISTLQPLPFFPFMKDLVTYLKSRNVTVYCVTASVRWAVEPAAEAIGIPAENVIGIRTQILDGKITDKHEGPLTWREGKVTGLLEKTGRKLPFLAAGNTMGDLPLLDSALRIRIANLGAPPGHFNRESEEALLAVARKRGWFLHSYRP